MTYCHRCRSTHLADDARMVDRFTPNPAGFRANYDGAPLRDTRSAAVADMCAKRAKTNPDCGCSNCRVDRTGSYYR